MFNPSHPGDLIRESLDGLRAETGQLLPLADVAERLGTAPDTLAAILDRHQPVTPALAPRLAVLFPNTTAAFWRTVQERYELKNRPPVMSGTGVATPYPSPSGQVSS